VIFVHGGGSSKLSLSSFNWNHHSPASDADDLPFRSDWKAPVAQTPSLGPSRPHPTLAPAFGGEDTVSWRADAVDPQGVPGRRLTRLVNRHLASQIDQLIPWASANPLA
jgi:hypothetical protein